MQRVWELWDLPQMVTQRGASTPDSPPACSRTVPTCTKSLRPDDMGALVPLSPLSCLSLSVETPWGSQCSGLLLGRLAWPPEQTVPAHTVPHWRCSSFPWFPLTHSDCRLLQTQPSPPCRSMRISHPEVRIQGAGSPLHVPIDAAADSPSLPRSGLRDIQPPAWPHKCRSVVPGLRAPAPSSVGKVDHTVHTRGQLLGEPETRSHPPSGCN